MTRILLIGLALAAGPLLQAQGGPPGGSVNALHVVEGVTRSIYAATDTGVYVSTNDGASWGSFSEGLPVDEFVVTSIAGDRGQLFAALDGAGVWRRRTGGSWVQTSDGIGDLGVLAVANKPGSGNVVLAGTRSQGVFFSDNNGDGWIRPGALTFAGTFPAIAFDPGNPEHILAAVNPGLIVESQDGGQVWMARLGVPGVAFRTIRFDPSDANVAYAASGSGLFRQPAPGQNFESLTGTAAFSFTDIAVDPADSSILYAAEQSLGVIVSTDRGATFRTSAGLPQAGGFSLAALPAEPTRLLAGAFGTGVFVSDDQAATFRLSSAGLNGANVLGIAADPKNAGVLFASTSGGGMFKSTNAGSSWTEARNGLFQFSPTRIAIDPTDSNRVYSGSINPFDNFDGSLARSDDAGVTWTSVLTGAPALGLALHPTDGQTVWYGTSSGFFANLPSLYRSRQRGASPEAILGTLNIRGVAVDPSNARNVYAITELQGAYELIRTADEGNTFSGSGQTQVRMFTVAVDPGNTRTIYLGTDAGVFRSTDGGAEFRVRNTGLPDNGAIAVVSLAIDVRDGAIYIATTSGVFKSLDGSTSWMPANTSLENIAVRQIAVDPLTASSLYAATAGAGVYRSTDGGANWKATGTNQALITREGIVNAFDSAGAGVAPGELVSIYGVGIGPSDGVAATAFDPATGKLATTLGGARVFFNDVAAPLLFVRADQINAQVPFEVAALSSAQVNVRIEFDGVISNTVQLTVLATHAGLYPKAVNFADGQVNAQTAPARAGDYILLYATGQGLTNPAVETGATPPAAEPFARSVAPAVVRFAGQDQTPLFVGLAPTFVGLLQLNVQVPAGLSPGPYEVALQLGGRTARTTATVWVGP